MTYTQILKAWLLGGMLALAGIYGYGASMTAHGPFIQGYIGTAIPVVIAGWCFIAGRISR